MTINSSERPNVVCGKRRLTPARWRISRLSAADSTRGSAGNTGRLSLGLEDIAGTTHGLQIAWITRIALDFPAQPRHLHIDIADVAAEPRRLRQFLARHRLSRLLRQYRQETGLGGGEVNNGVAAEQFAAREVETKIAKADFTRRRRRAGPALQDIADAQDELARLERLDEVIIGAVLEAVDPILGLSHRRQQQDRHAHPRILAQRAGQREAALARHHDIEHNEIEGKARELGARLGRVRGAGHAEAAVREVAAQQLAQPQIVIDNEEVGLALGHRAGLYGTRHERAARRSKRRRSSSPAMMPSRTLRKPSTACGPALRYAPATRMRCGSDNCRSKSRPRSVNSRSRCRLSWEPRC